jgi:hypothetical protein
LGVPITATLNYKVYYEGIITKLKEKTGQLNMSFASGPQRLQTILRCIIPGITYAFPVMPIGLLELNRCDAILAKCAKQAFKLPSRSPNRMVHLAKLDGGLGIPSLRVQYHQLNLAALVKSLNDEGTLGLVTRSLLRHQLRALQGLQPTEVPAAEARYFRLCKQLALANEIGVHMTMHGSPFVHEVSPLVKMMREITYDPMALGLREAIPARVYTSLMQLGITSLGDLTHEKGTHMISTTDLARKYGSKVSNKHKQALNILTTLVNEPAPDGVTMPSCGVLPLEKHTRKINRRQLAMELAAEVALAPMSKASEVLR